MMHTYAYILMYMHVRNFCCNTNSTQKLFIRSRIQRRFGADSAQIQRRFGADSTCIQSVHILAHSSHIQCRETEKPWKCFRRVKYCEILFGLVVWWCAACERTNSIQFYAVYGHTLFFFEYFSGAFVWKNELWFFFDDIFLTSPSLSSTMQTVRMSLWVRSMLKYLKMVMTRSTLILYGSITTKNFFQFYSL